MAKTLLDTLLDTLLKPWMMRFIKIFRKKRTSFCRGSKTIKYFKEKLEKHSADKVDKTLSRQITTQFQGISQKVRTNFYEMFSQAFETTKRDIENINEQGNATLDSWKEMMLTYKDLWIKSFCFDFLTAILLGVIVTLVPSFMLTRRQN